MEVADVGSLTSVNELNSLGCLVMHIAAYFPEIYTKSLIVAMNHCATWEEFFDTEYKTGKGETEQVHTIGDTLARLFIEKEYDKDLYILSLFISREVMLSYDY